MRRLLAFPVARTAMRARQHGTHASLTSTDTWERIRDEAKAKEGSPSFSRHGMDRFLHTEVLRHETIGASLAHLIGSKYAGNADSIDYIGGPDGSAVDYVGIITEALKADPAILEATAAE